MRCPNRWTIEFCAFISSISFTGYVVDVGAAFGYEIDVSRQLGYRVVGVECRYAEYARLKRKFDSDNNVTLVHACASNKGGFGKLYMGEDSSSLHSDSMRHVKFKIRREKHPMEYVPLITVDDIRKTMNLKIGLLKIDVQGHELNVLQGALSAIKNDHTHLFFECSSDFGCNSNNDYMRILNVSENYTCHCKENCACLHKG